MSALRRFVLLTLSVALAACGGAESTGPQPGQLDLLVSTPNADDRAIAVTVDGTISDVRPVTGYRIYVRARTDRTAIVVVPDGSTTFSSGETAVATLNVPDVSAASSYSVAIIQAAGAGYGLRLGGGYSARLR